MLLARQSIPVTDQREHLDTGNIAEFVQLPAAAVLKGDTAQTYIDVASPWHAPTSG